MEVQNVEKSKDIKKAKCCYLYTTLKNNKNLIEGHSKLSATDLKVVYDFTYSTAELI